MEYTFHTRLEGSIVLTSSFHTHTALQKDKTLYKFIWVRSGRLVLEVDHVEIILEKDDVIPLTPFHYLRIKQVEGEYLTILFNSNFYCIYGHDKEVSCNGFLFNGSSRLRNRRPDWTMWLEDWLPSMPFATVCRKRCCVLC